MYCVMCKWADGSTELVDTFPTYEDAEYNAQLERIYDKFLVSAGLHKKRREYFVEKETLQKMFKRGRG